MTPSAGGLSLHNCFLLFLLPFLLFLFSGHTERQITIPWMCPRRPNPDSPWPPKTCSSPFSLSLPSLCHPLSSCPCQEPGGCPRGPHFLAFGLSQASESPCGFLPESTSSPSLASIPIASMFTVTCLTVGRCVRSGILQQWLLKEQQRCGQPGLGSLFTDGDVTSAKGSCVQPLRPGKMKKCVSELLWEGGDEGTDSPRSLGRVSMVGSGHPPATLPASRCAHSLT